MASPIAEIQSARLDSISPSGITRVAPRRSVKPDVRPDRSNDPGSRAYWEIGLANHCHSKTTFQHVVPDVQVRRWWRLAASHKIDNVMCDVYKALVGPQAVPHWAVAVRH